MIRPSLIALVLTTPALLALASLPASAQSPEAVQAAEGRCSSVYQLAPGERRVLACQFKPRWPVSLPVVRSQHVAVDASLIDARNGFVMFSLHNSSTAIVTATFMVEVF